MPNESLSLLLLCMVVLLLAVVLALALIVLRFADVGALRRTLRAALPGRRGSCEKAYLRAIVHRLGTTPALLVIGSSSDTSHRDLRLLEAFDELRSADDCVRRKHGFRTPWYATLGGGNRPGCVVSGQ